MRKISAGRGESLEKSEIPMVLDEILKKGALEMLQEALLTEVEGYISHASEF